MRWPYRPDDGGPRWPWRAEFGRGQARGTPRGLTWRELAGTFSGPDSGSAADGVPSVWEWQGQRGGKDQASIVDQAVVVEGDLDAVGVVIW